MLHSLANTIDPNRLILVSSRCSKTVDRNLEMIDNMKKVLSGGEAQEEGRKPVKPQDLARLYETIIQVLIIIRRYSFPASKDGLVFLEKGAIPGLLFVYFCLF